MPRNSHRLVKDKKRSDLKLLIEKLLIHVEESEGMSRCSPVDSQLLHNLFSFYRRINDLTQEEVNIVWETAKMMITKILGEDADDLVEKEKEEKRKENRRIFGGKYWIFPDSHRYVPCDDHFDYALKNQQEFIDNLGINTMDYVHAICREGLDIMPLIMGAGGIMAEFFHEGEKKVARFVLCQCSVPWLKARLMSMPVMKSYLRIIDPTQPYSDGKSGVSLIYRRPVNAITKSEENDGTQRNKADKDRLRDRN